VATSVDFAMYRGEDKILRITLSPAQNISGWSFEYACRTNLDALPIAIAKSTVDGTIVPVNVADGIIDVQLYSGDTADLPLGDYHYDIQRVDTGSRTELVIGTQTLKQMVNPVPA
jgi:hypothetical protein